MKKQKKENPKQKPTIKNPHNNFVVKLFENNKNARKYFKSILPKTITKDIDWRTLKPSKVSWVDDKLKTVYSDINFKVKWKGMDIYVPIVLEHQSSRPNIPHLKIARYLINGYDYQIEQIELAKKKGIIKKGKAPKLTVIIPIFIYNGKEKWEYRPFYEFFEPSNEHIVDFIPNFKYLLHDLSKVSNEDLFNEKELGILASAFLLLKNYYDKDYIVSYSAEIIALAQNYSDGSSYFQFYAKIALAYIASSSKIQKKDVDQIVNSVDNPKLKNPFMTALEEIQLEGKRRIEEEKSREVIINLFQKALNLSDKEIAEIAGVSLSFVKKVKKELKQKK